MSDFSRHSPVIFSFHIFLDFSGFGFWTLNFFEVQFWILNFLFENFFDWFFFWISDIFLIFFYIYILFSYSSMDIGSHRVLDLALWNFFFFFFFWISFFLVNYFLSIFYYFFMCSGHIWVSEQDILDILGVSLYMRSLTLPFGLLNFFLTFELEVNLNLKWTWNYVAHEQRGACTA